MIESLKIEEFTAIDIIFSFEDSHEKVFSDNRERDDLIAGIILNNAISVSN